MKSEAQLSASDLQGSTQKQQGEHSKASQPQPTPAPVLQLEPGALAALVQGSGFTMVQGEAEAQPWNLEGGVEIEAHDQVLADADQEVLFLQINPWEGKG